MPAYISHAVMGEQLYNECKRENILSNIEISIEALRGYSLGPDLASLSKKLKTDPHNSYTKDFFFTMINYIKEKNLTEDKNIMSLLYGHIAHYFLDINTHPFIFYIEKGCKNVGMISNHHLVEGYLDKYLVERVLNKNIMDIDEKYFNKINLSNAYVSQLLNEVYGKVYGDYNIVKTYKYVLFIFSTLEKATKSGMISYKNIVKFSKFKEFLNENNLTIADLNNEIHNIYLNPVTGKSDTMSFIEAYNKALEDSLEAINIVNHFLYDNYSDDICKNVFTNLSYDTGVNCSFGKKMVYKREK